MKAAWRLGRVQSNVTPRIQQLEGELDAQLLIWENKKIRLSPQGKKFLVYPKRASVLLRRRVRASIQASRTAY
ncbi:hypothetical protein KLEPA_00175 (plasmid) [Klebsiella pneumoniae]